MIGRHHNPPLRWCRFTIVALLCAALPSPGAAFTLKSLIMPGKVIESHADIEDTCESCHESDDSQKQSELCYVCHDDIRTDVVSKTNLHGRHPAIANGECSSCHGEHDGRDGDITGLDPQTFEHVHTDFPLLGVHGGTACAGTGPLGT